MPNSSQRRDGQSSSPTTSASNPQATDPNTIPDGGYHAWAQVVSGHLVVALTWGYSASFGVFQNYYEKVLPQSPSDISWIGGFQVFCLFFISTLSGRATDAGFARGVVTAGAALLLLGIFMASVATSYWQIFLTQGLCVGLGQGLMWLPSVTLISTYFARKRVFAITTAATGTSTGGVIFPAMIQYLIPKIGFPWAIRCMGFVILFMIIIVLGLIRSRIPPRKSGPWIEWSAFKEPAYLLFTFGIFLLQWTLYYAFFYIQVYTVDVLHLSEETGVNLIIIINACGFPIRAAYGILADRYIGPLNSLIPRVAVCGIMMFCWATIDDVTHLYIVVVFFGISSAAALGLFAGTVPSLTKDLDKIGTRVGMILTLISFGPLTGPSVAGALIERTGGSYLAGQIWAGASLLLSAVVLIAARLITSGPRLRAKI